MSTPPQRPAGSASRIGILTSEIHRDMALLGVNELSEIAAIGLVAPRSNRCGS